MSGIIQSRIASGGGSSPRNTSHASRPLRVATTSCPHLASVTERTRLETGSSSEINILTRQSPPPRRRENLAGAVKLRLYAGQEQPGLLKGIIAIRPLELFAERGQAPGAEVGAAALQAVGGALERPFIRFRDGPAHQRPLARRVFQVQLDQLDDQI